MRVRDSRVEVKTQVPCPGSPLPRGVFSGKLPNLSTSYLLIFKMEMMVPQRTVVR